MVYFSVITSTSIYFGIVNFGLLYILKSRSLSLTIESPGVPSESGSFESELMTSEVGRAIDYLTLTTSTSSCGVQGVIV